MKKKTMPILVVVFLILAIGTVYAITELGTSKTQMDLTEYYGDVGENEAVLILGSEILPEKAVILNEKTYLPLSVVQNTLNQVFFWDAENQSVLYASPTELINEKVSENGETRVLNWNDNIYVQTDFVQEHTDIDVYYEENPNRLAIQYQWTDAKFVSVKKDSYIHVQADKRSDVLVEVPEGETLWFLGSEDGWFYVSQKNGFIGYIRDDECDEPEMGSIKRDPVETYSYISRDYKINMVWHQVTSELANEGLDDTVAEVTGINVLSPTWFALMDESGNVQSIATQTYVEDAHSRGWEVWGLIDNFTYDVNTTNVLASTASRSNMVNQLIQYAMQYNLDGINVDFEYLSEEAGPYFLQFLRELSIETHKNNIALSVDNPVPEDFTSHYDRAEQGRVVDYVIIMGYDEHYVGSEAGSVASLSWVERGIQETLLEVPASRTINAVPFYCRVWRTTSENLETEAIGMWDAQEVLNVNNVETYWDTQAGQNYGSYTDRDGNSCEIWVEDAESIATKVQLVGKYDLAGVAAWKLGFETSDIWQVISKNLG